MCLPHSGCPCPWSYAKKSILQKFYAWQRSASPIGVFSMQLSRTEGPADGHPPAVGIKRWADLLYLVVMSQKETQRTCVFVAKDGFVKRPRSNQRNHHLLIDPEDHNSPNPSKGWHFLTSFCPSSSQRPDTTSTSWEPQMCGAVVHPFLLSLDGAVATRNAQLPGTSRTKRRKTRSLLLHSDL